MRVLLIYGSLALGGIETLIVRLANWLDSQGHNVSVLLTGPGELDSLLANGVKVLSYSGNSPDIDRRAILKSAGEVLHERYDAVMAFDPISVCAAAFLSRHVLGNPRFLAGVYHPRIYFFEKPAPIYLRLIRRIFIEHVSDDSKAFMNHVVRQEHQKVLQQAFSGSSIVPLPIDCRKLALTPRRPKWGKIVSIGRLTAFKTYNLYMIDIVKQLHDKGFDVEWHVYGEGELKPLMEERIERNGLGGQITLHGAISYASFTSVLEDAYGFIGMGTALIEAGACGVPCIPAIDAERDITYGFLPELPYFVVGERLEGTREIAIISLLEKLLAMDRISYETECDRVRKYCAAYDVQSVGAMFVDLLARKAGHISSLRSVPWPLRAKLRAYWTWRRLTAGVESRAIRAFKKVAPGGVQGMVRHARRKANAKRSLNRQGLRG